MLIAFDCAFFRCAVAVVTDAICAVLSCATRTTTHTIVEIRLTVTSRRFKELLTANTTAVSGKPTLLQLSELV